MNRVVLQFLPTAAALLAAVMACATARAQESKLPRQVEGLEVQEHVGATLPMELEFETFDGRKVTLGDYFPAATGRVRAGELPKPAVVFVGYYSCPVVCPVVQDKFVEALNDVDMSAGKDFNFLAFSFNPDDLGPSARGARERALSGYRRSGSAEIDAGFAYHAGSVEATRQLANALGFPYRKIENGEYSHPVALFVISPEGVISRYIYGFDYPPTQVKLALLDASDGKLARSIGDRFLFFCYTYDASRGKYTIEAIQVMKLGGALTVAGVAALVGGLRLSEYLRKRDLRKASGAGGPARRTGTATTGGAGGPAGGGPSATGPVA